MKVWKKSVLIATMMLFAGLTFGQSYAVDTLRLYDAYDRLVELQDMDKGAMTKAEKKAWKTEKRMTKQIIAQEEDKIRFNQQMYDAWRFGYPYGRGFYNFGYPVGVWGASPFIYNTRPVFVRRAPVRRAPVCRVPAGRP
ncbi:MAG: hypothetical protein AAFY71_00540 [Bacteroidota bacterium]